jgi:alkyldihydroxyacetonephosphate synthase
MSRRRAHWGWGYEDEQATVAQMREAAPGMAAYLGMGSAEIEEPVPLADVALPAPRVQVPPGLATIADASTYGRAAHAMGKSYRDVVRGFRGRFDHPPDVVLHPRDERDVEAALEWAAGANVAVVPYGGGTSVVGGVECPAGRFDGVATLDLTALDRVLEVDETSRAARIQAGASGPVLEEQLGSHGLTMRFYPQSFELATLGGWIATRAGGHFATVWTHIDDVVESVRAITPDRGVWESRRLPGSGAGVSPDRMLLGSEGTLGVITEAWVRVQPRPAHRSGQGVVFGSFAAGAEAVRELSQSGLNPANCRLIDPAEAKLTGAGDGSGTLLVLGFETTHEGGQGFVDAGLAQALAICREHGGTWEERPAAGAGSSDGDAVGAWRSAFLRAPYLRDTFVAMGVLSETFETAITWDAFPAYHAAVTGAVREALGGVGQVSCRFTHVYPDRTSPCSPPPGAARSSSSGRRSRTPPARRSSRAAGPSPTTTPWAATTGPGTTGSGPTRSPPRWPARGPPSTAVGC